jgi:peroxiredoxin-like protein
VPQLLEPRPCEWLGLAEIRRPGPAGAWENRAPPDTTPGEKVMNLLDAYVYKLELNWTERRNGTLRAEDMPELSVSAPPEFAGDAGKWTPEHLLVAASASCLMATFLAIAELSKLTVRSFHMKAFARLEKVANEGYRFTEVTLAPEISVAPDDMEKAQKVLAKAEKNCFVNKSLKATVQIEPQFFAVQEELVR